jgi:two-component system, OmpR family, response regulator ArlR
MSRILIVEDEESMAKTLVRGLTQAGYSTTVINDGLVARGQDLSIFDLVILDWMLPHINGVDIMRYWRSNKKFNVPILMLTAKDDINSKVTGLDFGADDYISKFFDWQELLARIRTLLRRNNQQNSTYNSNISKLESIEYDQVNQCFLENKNIVHLTSTEFTILKYFFDHPYKLITRSQLINDIYDQEYDCNSNIIERHIKAIRSKLNYDPILTIRGSGYRLRLKTSSQTH